MNDQLKRAVLNEDYDLLYSMLATDRMLSRKVDCIAADNGLHADDDIDDILTILMENLSK